MSDVTESVGLEELDAQPCSGIGPAGSERESPSQEERVNLVTTAAGGAGDVGTGLHVYPEPGQKKLDDVTAGAGDLRAGAERVILTVATAGGAMEADAGLYVYLEPDRTKLDDVTAGANDLRVGAESVILTAAKAVR